MPKTYAARLAGSGPLHRVCETALRRSGRFEVAEASGPRLFVSAGLDSSPADLAVAMDPDTWVFLPRLLEPADPVLSPDGLARLRDGEDDSGSFFVAFLLARHTPHAGHLAKLVSEGSLGPCRGVDARCRSGFAPATLDLITSLFGEPESITDEHLSFPGGFSTRIRIASEGPDLSLAADFERGEYGFDIQAADVDLEGALAHRLTEIAVAMDRARRPPGGTRDMARILRILEQVAAPPA